MDWKQNIGLNNTPFAFFSLRNINEELISVPKLKSEKQKKAFWVAFYLSSCLNLSVCFFFLHFFFDVKKRNFSTFCFLFTQNLQHTLISIFRYSVPPIGSSFPRNLRSSMLWCCFIEDNFWGEYVWSCRLCSNHRSIDNFCTDSFNPLFLFEKLCGICILKVTQTMQKRWLWEFSRRKFDETKLNDPLNNDSKQPKIWKERRTFVFCRYQFRDLMTRDTKTERVLQFVK